jgi:hypothetical protein
VKEPMNDDERLSALFEGRVVGRERDELLAHLAASDDDYEVFADTAEILRALEDEDALVAAGSAPQPGASPGVPEEVLATDGEGTLPAASGVIPFPQPRRTGWWHRPVAKAAVIAGIALVSALGLARLGRASGAAEPVQLATRLDGGLPADWTNDRPWETVRGGGPSGERNALAAQAGAMLMQLAVAAQSGDAAATRTIATQMVARYDHGAAPGTPLRRFVDGPSVPPDSLQPLLQLATTRLEDRLGRDHLRLGAWVEAARLGARARNQPFFGAGDTEAALNYAEKQTRGDDAARAALEQVRAALPADGPPEWESLEAGLKTLLGEIAS